MGITLFIAIIVLLVLGFPVAFALAISAALAVLVGGRYPQLVVFKEMFTGIDSFPLMAVPFFILSAELMSGGALTHVLLPVLHRAPKAYVLNVASTAAYQAVPSLALYAASKAFLLSFSRGLRYELKSSNVSVTCLCPGATITSFADRAGMGAELQATANKVSMTAEAVAEAAVAGMLVGEAEIIPGVLNKVSAGLTSMVPKGLVEKIAAGIYEKYL